MIVVSGHQPVYLPWLGLIHKASLADIFIFMDDVQYLVRDWNNRNLLKSQQGQPLWLTVPVDLKNSPSKTLKDILITQENVAPERTWQHKHWNTIKSIYAKAPHFKTYQPFFEWLYLEKKWLKLSELNLALLKQIFEWFDIKAKIVMASEHDFSEKKSDLVLEHGLKFKADIVLTGMHGKDYIDTAKFGENGIKVVFQEYKHPVYAQQMPGEFLHIAFIDLLFSFGPESRKMCLENNLTREELCKLASV
jgi:hypothetical protein